jgi:hypothetical protein
MPKLSKTRRRPHRKKTERGRFAFGAIQKWPARDKAMLRNLYEMFASAERFEQKHPEIIKQVDGARTRSIKKPKKRSAHKYASRSPRAKTKILK